MTEKNAGSAGLAPTEATAITKEQLLRWHDFMAWPKPAFHGFMDEENCCVHLCFTPSAPRYDGVYATAYYTHPSADLRGAAEQALKAMANYRVAVSYMDLAMKDGINRQGAMSELIDSEDVLDAAIASLEAAISRKGKTE